MNDSQMIYVHIPFCKKRCDYCAFVSCTNFQIVEKYFCFLKNEIQSCKYNTKPISSIYFGGGTPSVVDEKYICETLSLIKSKFKIMQNCEISIECNPESTTLSKLKAFYKAGFNRISFGVQSLNEKELLKIGRNQNAVQVKNAMKNALKVGFENLSVDLLLGLEGQTCKSLEKQIEQLNMWGATHLSLYMLMIEENTKLFKNAQNGLYLPLEDEICVQLYDLLFKKLKELGFYRYEVSNFAKNGFICKHNLGYWQMKPYLGFGVSAHSFIDGKRIANPDNFMDYFNGKYNIEKCNQQSLNEEYIMLGLRTIFGVEENFIKNTKQLNLLLQKGIVIKSNSKIRVADDYFGVLNQIILKLI